MTKKDEHLLIAAQGDKLAMLHQRTDSDSPMLPVEDIRLLKEICPDAVQLILDETKKEAEFRRIFTEKEQAKYYFQRGLGQVLAFLMGTAGIIGGVVCVVYNHPAAGTTIASLAIGTLALAFLGRSKQATK